MKLHPTIEEDVLRDRSILSQFLPLVSKSACDKEVVKFRQGGGFGFVQGSTLWSTPFSQALQSE
jgi:hypothetical protein